jgi:hypothetical protein
MAPDAKILNAGVTTRLATAKADLYMLELLFSSYNITDDKTKISIFFRTLDMEASKFILKNSDKFSNITWRQLKGRLSKLLEEYYLFEILKARQRLNEPASVWLERIITIAYNAQLDEKFAKKLIFETVLDENSFVLYRDFFHYRSLYDNYMNTINMIKLYEKEKQKIDFEKEKEKQNKDYQTKTPITNTKVHKTKTYTVNNLHSNIDNFKMKELIVNGVTLNAIFDTGSDLNLISKSLVEENGLFNLKLEEVKITNIFNQENTLIAIRRTDS